MLTSSSERRDVREAYARGANSYVVKPQEYAELVEKLGDLLRYWLQVDEGVRDRTWH